MKKYIYPIFFFSFLALIAMSNRNGRAASTGLGSTGAPGDDATVCRSCHNGPTDVAIDFFLIRGADTLQQYEPGKTYSIHILVKHISGTAPKAHGFQLTGLKAKLGINGVNITELTPESSNVKLSVGRNGRTYAEHNDRSPTNLFVTTWVAPSAGTGSVSFYAGATGVNANNSESGDGGNRKSVQIDEMIVSVSNELRDQKVMVYPNPFQQKINIESDQTVNKIIVRDLLGKLILQQTSNTNVITLDLSKLSDGIYFLQAINTEEKIIKTSKIIKRGIKA